MLTLSDQVNRLFYEVEQFQKKIVEERVDDPRFDNEAYRLRGECHNLHYDAKNVDDLVARAGSRAAAYDEHVRAINKRIRILSNEIIFAKSHLEDYIYLQKYPQSGCSIFSSPSSSSVSGSGSPPVKVSWPSPNHQKEKENQGFCYQPQKPHGAVSSFMNQGFDFGAALLHRLGQKTGPKKQQSDGSRLDGFGRSSGSSDSSTSSGSAGFGSGGWSQPGRSQVQTGGFKWIQQGQSKGQAGGIKLDLNLPKSQIQWSPSPAASQQRPSQQQVPAFGNSSNTNWRGSQSYWGGGGGHNQDSFGIGFGQSQNQTPAFGRQVSSAFGQGTGSSVSSFSNGSRFTSPNQGAGGYYHR